MPDAVHGLRLIHESVDDLLVLFLLLVSAEEAVPEDKDTPVVLIKAPLVGSCKRKGKRIISYFTIKKLIQ